MSQYQKYNSVHLLLGSPYFACMPTNCWVDHTLAFVMDRLGFCIKSNAVSKASSNSSSEEYRQRLRIKRGGVSLSPALALAFLLKFCNCYIITFGGWLYFYSILLRQSCVLHVNSGADAPQNTFWPKVDKLRMNKAIRLHVVENDIYGIALAIWLALIL